MTYKEILRQYFGFDEFRGIQQEIIESIGAGRDTLGLMPTGGGKSITFQVPALAKEGVCLVISPLIALMKDQVEHLRKKGVKAITIHTGMSHEEVLVALESLSMATSSSCMSRQNACPPNSSSPNSATCK